MLLLAVCDFTINIARIFSSFSQSSHSSERLSLKTLFFFFFILSRVKNEQWEGVYIKHFSIFFLFFILACFCQRYWVLYILYTYTGNCFALIIHIECFFSHCSKQSIDFFSRHPFIFYIYRSSCTLLKFKRCYSSSRSQKYWCSKSKGRCCL